MEVLYRSEWWHIKQRYTNSGSLSIGTADTGSVIFEAGSSASHTHLNLGTSGTLEYQFEAPVTTFSSTKTNAGAANTLDGLLTLDFTSFALGGAAQSFTLIDSNDDDVLIAGNLKTSLLDANAGILNGTGNYTSTYFQIENAAMQTCNGHSPLLTMVET